jgi:hypothetical protein
MACVKVPHAFFAYPCLPSAVQWAAIQRPCMFCITLHHSTATQPPPHLTPPHPTPTSLHPQGEQEAAAGIPISPPCDRTKVCMPAAQLFFIERFMAPTLEAFASSAPSFHTLAAAWLADTQVRERGGGEWGRSDSGAHEGVGNKHNKASSSSVWQRVGGSGPP